MMKIVFMGTPEFAAPVLQALIDGGYAVAAVYTRPDAPAGRGREMAASPVKRLAEKYGLNVVQPRSLKKPDAIEELSRLAPDAVVVAAYGLILPQAVLDIPRYGCVNVHASLLPAHRGAAPIAASILAGDDFSGVSIMKMDAGIDTGAVYGRFPVPVFDWDTAGTLSDRLSIVGAAALLDVLPQIWRKTIEALPQPADGASYAPMLAKEQGRIEWAKPAVEIWRQVRAFQPWPGAYTTWDGKLLKLIEAQPLDTPSTAPPGTVIYAGGRLGVAAGGGALVIKRLQLEGKRPSTAEEFLRGARGFVGALLGP